MGAPSLSLPGIPQLRHQVFSVRERERLTHAGSIPSLQPCTVVVPGLAEMGQT